MKHHLVIPLAVLGCLFVWGASSAEMQTVRSPDGQLSVKLELREGEPTWSVAFAGNLLLSPGHLGVSIDGDRAAPYSHVSQATNTNREQVKTTWGKFAEYDDHYNELRWTLNASAGRTIIIVVRVYDQGLGIRYEFPVDGGWGETIKLTAADTEFCFASDATGWCYNRERDPIGPQPLSKFHGGKGMDLPLTVKCDSAFVGVLEAAIFDQAPYRLNPLPSAATAFRETFSTSTLPAGGKTSWRVVLVGEQPGDLLTSPVMYCLNPPCQIENTDWIKPGSGFLGLASLGSPDQRWLQVRTGYGQLETIY